MIDNKDGYAGYFQNTSFSWFQEHTQGKPLFCDFIYVTFFFKGIKITVNPESKAVLAGQLVKLCCRATGHPFVQYQWFKMNKEVIFFNVF